MSNCGYVLIGAALLLSLMLCLVFRPMRWLESVFTEAGTERGAGKRFLIFELPTIFYFFLAILWLISVRNDWLMFVAVFLIGPIVGCLSFLFISFQPKTSKGYYFKIFDSLSRLLKRRGKE